METKTMLYLEGEFPWSLFVNTSLMVVLINGFFPGCATQEGIEVNVWDLAHALKYGMRNL